MAEAWFIFLYDFQSEDIGINPIDYNAEVQIGKPTPDGGEIILDLQADKNARLVFQGACLRVKVSPTLQFESEFVFRKGEGNNVHITISRDLIKAMKLAQRLGLDCFDHILEARINYYKTCLDELQNNTDLFATATQPAQVKYLELAKESLVVTSTYINSGRLPAGLVKYLAEYMIGHLPKIKGEDLEGQTLELILRVAQ